MQRIFLLCIFLLFWTTTSFAQSFWKPVFHSQDSYWADSILVNLSEEERIAQLFMVAAYSNKDEKHTEEISALIRDYKIGGLMFLQGSPTKQAQLTNYFQSKFIDLTYKRLYTTLYKRKKFGFGQGQPK